MNARYAGAVEPTQPQPNWWPAAIAWYAAVGFVAGLAEPFGRLVFRGTEYPLVSPWVCLLILAPGGVLAVAFCYPRLAIGLAGAAITLVALIAGAGVGCGITGSRPTPDYLVLPGVHLVVLAVLALVAAASSRDTRVARRLDIEDPTPRCRACGYPLVGLSDDRCPECGRDSSAETDPRHRVP